MLMHGFSVKGSLTSSMSLKKNNAVLLTLQRKYQLLYYQLEKGQKKQQARKGAVLPSLCVNQSGKKPMVANPVADVRFDGVHH